MPAAGQARRVAPLPCSKELYPVAFQPVENGRGLRPKVVCHYLLGKMCLTGITNVYVVLRKGKWDIPQYFGNGGMTGLDLAYLISEVTSGVPYSLDTPYSFVGNAVVALGFPDILFQPDDAFVRLLAQQSATNADVMLGLFLAHQPEKMDMVDIAQDGRIRLIEISLPRLICATPGLLHSAHPPSPVFCTNMSERLTFRGNENCILEM